MKIEEILRRKGTTVTTVRPTATVRELNSVLAEHNIGAAVVSDDGETIDGIVSERDLVRSLAERGTDVLDAPVAEIMTADVRTCEPNDYVDDLRHLMTDHRIRHVPVVRDGKLAGLVSIGDVVKSALSELEDEKEHLISYIQHG